MPKIKWIKISEQLPPNGVLVYTKIEDEQGVRNLTCLKRIDNLYFSGDVYVYYKPTHWAKLNK